MKRRLALLLACTMACSMFTGCGKKETSNLYFLSDDLFAQLVYHVQIQKSNPFHDIFHIFVKIM